MAAQGPPAPPSSAGDASASDASVAVAPAAGTKGSKGSDKKKDRKAGGAGVVIGKGTALLRTYVEKAAAAAAGKTVGGTSINSHLRGFRFVVK